MERRSSADASIVLGGGRSAREHFRSRHSCEAPLGGGRARLGREAGGDREEVFPVSSSSRVVTLPKKEVDVDVDEDEDSDDMQQEDNEGKDEEEEKQLTKHNGV